MTCATCHKEITLNSFYEFEKYFCTKECKDKHRVCVQDGLKLLPDDGISPLIHIGFKKITPAENGFNTIFDETKP